MDIFENLESEVRSYCRSFPTVFTSASGCHLSDNRNRRYLDFFAGAGALNYGHNPPELKKELIDYIRSDGITHSLDMATAAKQSFLETFENVVLAPRGLDYKLMFPGPTGTNAVEAALKLARKVTGRTSIIAFTNAFHGMTLGSLAITGNERKRAGAGVSLQDAARMPYEGYLGQEVDSIEMMEQFLCDRSSGVEGPAAVVLETVQAEGGINVASAEWLRRLADVTRKHGALLIVDDIQVGCGRTGPFFSFEEAGIRPDIVCLSKSLSAYGHPFSLVLLDRKLDCWDPGEHNGTFRGNNLAFVTARAALQKFWSTDHLSREVERKGRIARERLEEIAAEFDCEVRGKGLILGLAFDDAAVASKVSRESFRRRLLVETSGPDDEVVKVMPPLVVDDEALAQGLDLLVESVATVAERSETAVADTQPSAGKGAKV